MGKISDSEGPLKSPSPREVSVLQVLTAHTLDVHIPNFLVSVAASLEMPLISLLGRRYQLSNNYIAQLVALVALSRAVIDIPCGFLIEFLGLRRVMIASVLLNVCAAVIGLTSTTPMSLLVFCGLSGSSMGCFFLARHVFVAKVVAKRYRGTYMSTISGLMRWAHVLGPTFGGVVIHYTGEARNAMYISIASTFTASLCLLLGFWPSATNITLFSPNSFRTRTELSFSGEKSSLVDLSHDCVGCIDLLHPPFTSPTSSWQSPRPHCSPTSGGLSGVMNSLRQNFRTIVCLGMYVIFFTALRANRKLMITFAGMQASLSDADLTFLISFGFSVDAILFPLGGLVIDRLGRQWAMVPVTLGFALIFSLLPFASTKLLLFVGSGLFGLADSLGCGLIMTLVADRAPAEDSAPFFGIMRTLEDIGHVLGASGVGRTLVLIGFAWTCRLLSFLGVFSAVWGVLLIPSDPPDEDELDELVPFHYTTRKPRTAPYLTGPLPALTDECPLLWHEGEDASREEAEEPDLPPPPLLLGEDVADTEAVEGVSLGMNGTTRGCGAHYGAVP